MCRDGRNVQGVPAVVGWSIAKMTMLRERGCVRLAASVASRYNRSATEISARDGRFFREAREASDGMADKRRPAPRGS